jgi:adenylate kinase family enzyme
MSNSLQQIIDKNNLKFEKEIGSGANGTTYLVSNKNNEELILKIERTDVYNESEQLSSEYYRQVEFDENIAKKYPNNFMILEKHGIIDNCDYIHPRIEEFKKDMEPDRIKRFDRKNSQPTCYYLLYSPYLDGELKTVRTKIMEDKNLFVDFLYQIIYSINILKKSGYSQNDLNERNIMYKKSGNSYKWYIIDYGHIYHKKYPESEKDKDIGKKYDMDLYKFINNCCIRHRVAKMMENYKIKIDNYLREDFLLESEYKNIMKSANKITNEKMRNLAIVDIMQIKYPNLLLKYANKIDEKRFGSDELNCERKIDINKQLVPDLLINIIEYYDKDNYDNLLSIIENEYLKISSGGGYSKKYAKYEQKIKIMLSGGEKLSKKQKKFIKFIEKQFGGKRHKHILLFGVSSVGKSTIARIFEKKGYTRISYDAYWLNEEPKHKALIEIEKNIMTLNQYTPNRQDYRVGRKSFNTFIHKMMYNDAINKDVVYDDFSSEIADFYKNREDIFVIHVYASPYKIIDNILRRRFIEPRDRGVFQHFRSTYISTTDDDKDYIDIINRKTFIDTLKEKLKHEFSSEEDLIMTANEMFEKMDITDDNDHKIKLRGDDKYDHLVKIENETIEDIMNSLAQFTE